MATCDVCGRVENMPYNCRLCGGTHCGEHRLPENHTCPGLDSWNDPGGVFDSGFDASVAGGGGPDRSLASRLGLAGLAGYVKGNVTYTFLALMWITYAAQFVAIVVGGQPLHNTLFTLDPDNPEYVWTWFTSIFAHSPFPDILHIAFNSIVIFFFGPLVERYIGSRKFAVFFLASGAIAGLGQISLGIMEGGGLPVLGASGAALAIMGILTVFNPGLKVYLYFILPIPIWLLTAGVALFSFLFVGIGEPGAGNVAHMAHLVGLLVGLAYGQYYKQTHSLRPPRRLEFGGGGRGGPPRRRF